MNKRMIAVMLCSAVLLGGCSKTEESQTENIPADVEEARAETVPADTGESSAAVSQEEAQAGDNAVVIETGPDKKLHNNSNLVYTLYDFRLYESPGEASISSDEILIIDAAYYADRSKFLTMQADINNIDYSGDSGNGEGEMNLSLFTISPNEPDESLQWAGSLPVYLSDHGNGETDYYHVWVKPGETKTVTVGFYVPVNNIEELRSQCKISFYGSYDEGYLYEIPTVQ